MRAFPSEARTGAKSTRASGTPAVEWQRLSLLCCCALALAFPGTRLLGAAPAARQGKADARGIQPEVRIPVGALGYMAPGELPEFGYEAMVELHFIDATHLLFTFNIDGLLRRDDSCATAETKRKVRAIVLAIPSRKVEKQAEWNLYHFSDYLWKLGYGKFLLQRCSHLQVVGASLDPQPLVDAGGEIVAIGFSRDRSVMMVEELSQTAGQKPRSAKNPVFGPGGPPAEPVNVSFIRLHPLQIIARARLPYPGMVPIVKDGILEALAGPKNSWTINLLPFHGAKRKIAGTHSACRPTVTPVSDAVTVLGVCSRGGKRSFEGYDNTGLLLWRIPEDDQRVHRTFLLTRNGAHFAIESLHAKQPLGALDPLTKSVIDGEIIDVYDTTTGAMIGSLHAQPAYTAGRNADFSPDGARIAVLSNGAIEIYSLSELGKRQ